MRASRKPVLVAITTPMIAPPAIGAKDTRKSVVKIYTVHNRYNYDGLRQMWGYVRERWKRAIRTA